MKEAFHRALMAFPDEDVVVGSRFVSADALIAFKDLDTKQSSIEDIFVNLIHHDKQAAA